MYKNDRPIVEARNPVVCAIIAAILVMILIFI